MKSYRSVSCRTETGVAAGVASFDTGGYSCLPAEIHCQLSAPRLSAENVVETGKKPSPSSAALMLFDSPESVCVLK